MNLLQAGPLDDITNWLKRQWEAMWAAIWQLIQDAFYWCVEGVMDVFATIIEAIPVPEFLQNGLGGMFSFLPAEILYFVGLFRIPEGLLMVGTGVAFRLLRKLLTVGQW